MKISQQQFNEDVKTTMDEFEVPLEEAINMTIEEYQIQGYDLTGIDKSEEAVLFDPSIAHNLSQQIKSQNSFQSMKELFDSIKDSSILPSYLTYFIEDEVLDKLAEVVTDNDLQEFFEIASIFCSFCQDEQFVSKPFFYSFIQKGISSTNPIICKSALQLLSILLSNTDTTRVICSYLKIDILLINLIQQTISIEALDCLISLVNENAFSIETRNTRIRQLLENETTLPVLVQQLANHKDNKEIVKRICLLLSKLVIDEPSCRKLANDHIITILTSCLDYYIDDLSILYSILKLFTSLARDDKMKFPIFSSFEESKAKSLLISPLSFQLPKNIIIALLDLLSVLALRNNTITMSLVESYHFYLPCFQFMKSWSQDRKIQIHGCFLLRICISASEECEQALVSQGLMDHINKIMNIDNDIRIACVQLKRSIKSVTFSV